MVALPIILQEYFLQIDHFICGGIDDGVEQGAALIFFDGLIAIAVALAEYYVIAVTYSFNILGITVLRYEFACLCIVQNDAIQIVGIQGVLAEMHRWKESVAQIRQEGML